MGEAQAPYIFVVMLKSVQEINPKRCFVYLQSRRRYADKPLFQLQER